MIMQENMKNKDENKEENNDDDDDDDDDDDHDHDKEEEDVDLSLVVSHIFWTVLHASRIPPFSGDFRWSEGVVILQTH